MKLRYPLLGLLVVAMSLSSTAQAATARARPVRDARLVRAPRLKVKRVPRFTYQRPQRHLTSRAELVRVRSEQRLTNGKRVIHAALSQQPLGSIDRTKIFNNLNFGIEVIRNHVTHAVSDGYVTPAERRQITLVSQAVARDLEKSFGAIAPWHAITL